jgi:hypothetical protein
MFMDREPGGLMVQFSGKAVVVQGVLLCQAELKFDITIE